MKPSALFSINLKEALHGLIVAAGTAAFTVIESSVSTGTLAVNWKQVGLAALAGGLAYIGKKFFQSPKMISDETTQ